MGQLSELIEKNTDVWGENASVVLDAAHMLVAGGEMFFEGSATFGAAGVAAPVVMLGLLWYELFYAAHAKAKADVKRRNVIIGYAIGAVSGALGEPVWFVKKKFWVNRAYFGVGGDQDIADAGMNAHNQGLVMGYKEASALSAAQKKKFLDMMGKRYMSEIKARGGAFVYTGDEDYILGLAGAFVGSAVK